MQIERKRLGLDHQEISEKISVGKATYYRWEAGKAIPSDKLAELAKLGFDVNFIVTGKRTFSGVSNDNSYELEQAVDAACYAAKEAIMSVYQVQRLRKELGENGEFDAIKSLSLIEKATRILAKAELTGELDNDSLVEALSLNRAD
ncbi:helix-turn-helix domain-containing protein [Pseudoalteromonas phenolica]|uniref:helix-turn-helix domain-containing protein n=1 Tax=Pseudoalteromonas phenolica TaxID=161398 RepID=UPI0020163CE6|nr:helix-turn-helix transcriptional regulator [Pseudoalteromonas phenolica]